MRVGIIQFDIAWNDDTANYEKLAPMIAEAAAGGSRLVLLPEMFNSGFSFLNGDEAVRFNRSGTDFLKTMSLKHSIAICGSLPDQPVTGRPFNSLYVFDRGKLLGTYRKLHLFSFGGEPEKYQSGNELLNFSIDTIRFSFFICYDLRFPIPFELLGPSTDAFVIVANWPAARSEHWRTLLTARAIEQQAYVLGVNRIGSGGGLEYSGDSLCITPRGVITCDAKSTPAVHYADVSADEVSAYRASFTALKDRKTELYDSFPTGHSIT
jgi:predicted amidohydrolase